MNEKGKKGIFLRVYLSFVVIGIFALSIFFRIIYIQYVEGDRLIQQAQKQSFREKVVKAIRGNIYSEKNELLATSVPMYNLYWDAKVVSPKVFNEGIDSLAYQFHQLFPLTPEAVYKKRFTEAYHKEQRYFRIARKVDYAQLKKIKQMPILGLSKYKGGLIIEKYERRKRPYKKLAKRTIGIYNNVKKTYVVGIEGAYNDVLKGEDGMRLEQRVAGGWRPIYSQAGPLSEPKNGDDVITSINVNIQDVAESSLERQLRKHHADWGCVVLMEVKTGAVKAIANLKLDTLSGGYTESFNFAIGTALEPGSTFKLPSLMVALEDQKVQPDDIIHTGNGEMEYKGRKMRDSHKGGFGDLTVKQVLEHSSNIGVFKIILAAYENNPQQYIDGLYRMGLNKPLGLEIKGEAKPYIKNPQDKTWSGISLPWMSIGYEMAVTPMQILTFYNAVANDGVMVKPRFVNSISRTGKNIKEFEPVILNKKIASDRVIKIAHEMLEGVVQEGTATILKSSPYPVAGKTGTAQTNYSNRQKRRRYRASFVGYFPADNPRYSIIVVIHNPKGPVYYASQLTVPVFKDIADKIYARDLEIQEHDKVFTGFSAPASLYGDQNVIRSIYNQLGYQPSTPDPNALWCAAVAKKEEKKVGVYIRNYHPGILPSLKGLNARDAIFFLESLGYYVNISGYGKVVSQSIPAGTRVQKGAEINITLN